METSNENIIVTEEKIIEKLNSIYGLDNTSKEEMMNYFNYIKLRKNKKISEGN